MMPSRKTKKVLGYAPRLTKGTRTGFSAVFPEAVKEGLKKIARSENQSMSWVIEQVVIDYFDLDRPKYKNDPRKKKMS